MLEHLVYALVKENVNGKCIKWRIMENICFIKAKLNKEKIIFLSLVGLIKKDCAIIIPSNR